MLITVAFSFQGNDAFAQMHKLQNGFAALNAGDYVLAEKQLKKCFLKAKYRVAAAFGLSEIFLAADNGNRKTDSADFYLRFSEALYNSIQSKTFRHRIQLLGVRPYKIATLRSEIYEQAWNESKKENSIASWNHFIQRYPLSPQLNAAVEKRNSLAWSEAKGKFNFESFAEFMERYPDAAQTAEAKSLFELLFYKSKTADSSWQSFQSFARDFPGSPYAAASKENFWKIFFDETNQQHSIKAYVQFLREAGACRFASQAEDSVYSIATISNTVASLEEFIISYPENHHKNDAWLRLYKIKCAELNSDSINAFAYRYPSFPFSGLINVDKESLSKKLFVFGNDSTLYGYINEAHDTIIPAKFTTAGPFQNGLALAQLCDTCLFGYINVHGDFSIPPQFGAAGDFHGATAVVAEGSCADSCLYGYINRFGEWMHAPEFLFADTLKENRFLVHASGSGYGFLDANARWIIQPVFDDAFSFSEGLAAVKKDSLFGFISSTASVKISFRFANARSFSEGFAPAKDTATGKWGYINNLGNWMIPPKFIDAYPFRNGNAKVLVEKFIDKKKKQMIPVEKSINTKGEIAGK